MQQITYPSQMIWVSSHPTSAAPSQVRTQVRERIKCAARGMNDLPLENNEVK